MMFKVRTLCVKALCEIHTAMATQAIPTEDICGFRWQGMLHTTLWE